MLDCLARCPLHWGGHRAAQTPQHNTTQEIMKITIHSKAIDNGKQHVLSVPFLGKFTIDQKDRNRAIAFIHSNNKGESLHFLRQLHIENLQKQIAKKEAQILVTL